MSRNFSKPDLNFSRSVRALPSEPSNAPHIDKPQKGVVMCNLYLRPAFFWGYLSSISASMPAPDSISFFFLSMKQPFKPPPLGFPHRSSGGPPSSSLAAYSYSLHLSMYLYLSSNRSTQTLSSFLPRSHILSSAANRVRAKTASQLRVDDGSSLTFCARGYLLHHCFAVGVTEAKHCAIG